MERSNRNGCSSASAAARRSDQEGEKKGRNRMGHRPPDRDGEIEVARRRVQNALKVMIVRVSTMPGIVCTLWPTKWPMSTSCST